MTTPVLPTTEQLKEMAEHVQYEVDEFRKAIRDLPGLRSRPTWNRALESALLHFRILRAFFFDERGRGNDDVFAQKETEPIAISFTQLGNYNACCLDLGILPLGCAGA